MRGLLRSALALALLVVASSAAAAPCAGFSDVEDTNAFCPNVAWIRNRNITLGCEAGLYCPNVAVSRLSMAAFLNRLGDVVLPPNVVWVAPVGGQFQSIQAAIDYLANRLPDAGGLVKVAAGWYVEQVTIPGNVVVEGAGRGLSEIRSQGGCGPGLPLLGGVTLENGAQLRRIHVSRITSGAPGDCVAIMIRNGRGVALEDVLVRIEGTTGVHHAVRIDTPDVDHPLVLDNVEIRASADPSSSAWMIGISALGGPLRRVTLRNVDASVSGPIAHGISLASVTARIERSTVNASAFGLSAIALTVTDSALPASDVLVQTSTLTTPSGFAAMRFTPGSLRIATSLLEGIVLGATCFGTYNAVLAPVAC